MREQDEILVVDDEPIVLKLLTDILSAEGFQVRSADTGEMAVRSVASKPPHLVLLDIQMPEMDGFEVCRRLQAQEETRDTVVIFVSVITDLEQRVKGFDLGAVDFITKPFQREELLARVRTHLELRRLRTKFETQVAERTAQLRMLAEEIEDLYDNAPCGYHSLDEDGVFLRINSTELDWLGYTRNELIGKKKFSDLIAPRNLPIFRENFSRFKIQGSLRDLELEIIRQDGTTFPALLNATGIPDSQGNYLMIRSILSNITARKQSEDVLRKSEEKYRTLFEHTGTALIILEEDTTVSLANNEFATLTGYTKAEIEGNIKSTDFAVPQDKDKILGYHRLRREDPAAAPREYESRLVDKNGNIIHTFNTVAMIPGTAKSIVSFIDITERKRAVEELRENEERYRKLFEHISSCVAIYEAVDDGADFLIKDFNSAGERIEDIVRDQVIGKRITEVFPGVADFGLLDVLRRVWQTGEPAHHPVSFYQDQRIQGWRKNYIYRLPSGEIVVVYEDITERKRAEEQIQHTLDSLRRAVGTTIQVMVSAVEARDAYTAGHQIRSADLARAIAAEMGLTKDQIDGIRMAGSIHDIGKLSIPAEILAKPTKLTEIEFALIKQHPLRGYEILKNVDSPWPLAQIVYQHHERMDGSGYPRSLRGNDILMEARILAVSDVVEAIASHRPYRPALGIDMALDEISQNRGILYDPEVVDACLRLFKEKGFKLE
ncbi:MAG: PAS domain S-box protein [Thermodesulfobacteriota bacterium]